MTSPEQSEARMPRMTLGEHLQELRRRLVWALIGLAVATAAMTVMARPILIWMQRPYQHAMEAVHRPAELTVLGLADGFSLYMNIALAAGVVVSAPWILYQLWMFVAAGLYPRERRFVRLAIPFSAGLFVVGAAFFFFAIAEPTTTILLNVSLWLGLQPMITLDSYVSFVLHMAIACGLVFQTPLAVCALAKAGVVSAPALSRYRRHVIVAVLILGGIVAPGPDVAGQLMLAVPMWLLYELGVLLARAMVFRRV